MLVLPDGTMTIASAATKLHLSRATLYLAISERKLQSHDVLGHMVVTQEDIADWRSKLGSPGRKKKRLTTVKPI